MTNTSWEKSRKNAQSYRDRYSNFKDLSKSEQDARRINTKEFVVINGQLVRRRNIYSLRAGKRSKRPISLAPIKFKDESNELG